jgi:hypothetical protein
MEYASGAARSGSVLARIVLVGSNPDPLPPGPFVCFHQLTGGDGCKLLKAL